MIDSSKATLGILSVLLTCVLAACTATDAPRRTQPRASLPTSCDVLITGGTVIDGTGAQGYPADVLVTGDRIAAVRRLTDTERARLEAREIVDARGKVVTPGFIDVHAHGDPLRTPQFANFTAMGVTTICLGLDGSSPNRDGDLATWLDAVDARRTAVHVAALVGHGTLRSRIAPDSSSPLDATGRDRLRDAVAEALTAGAFGLSTGLEYTPGRYADAAELTAAAEPLAAHDALIASHVRNEDQGEVDTAIAELLDQARSTGAHAHLSHAKIVHGRDPELAAAVLEQLASARQAGIRATADVYPYTASFTGLSILFPDWARPPHDYDTVVASRREDLASHLRQRMTSRGGPGATLIGTGPHAGRTLEEAAADQGTDYEQLLIELGPRGTSAAYFVMDEEVMKRLLNDPHTMVASDGSPTMRHPRGHGTFARVLRRFVVEQGLISLEEAVRKMTSLPARTVGIADRGRIAEGYCADLLVFDPASVHDNATFTEPFARATGFDDVLVAGQFVRRHGEPTDARPAGALRRSRSLDDRLTEN